MNSGHPKIYNITNIFILKLKCLYSEYTYKTMAIIKVNKSLKITVNLINTL
jgi:hypothetical protein